MANGYFQGTRQALADIIAREKQAELNKETPQYQQALFNLMQSKQQAIRQQAIMEQLRAARVEDIPRILAGTGDVDPFLKQQKAATEQQQKREFEVNEAIETFENLEPRDLQHIRVYGSLPQDAVPRLKIRQKQPLVKISMDPFERARQTALGSAAAKAETTINSVNAIVGDVQDLFDTFDNIPETFRGPFVGRTLGKAGEFFQLNPSLTVYQDDRQLTLANIAKKLGGEVGVLTDKDISRINISLPNPHDTEEVAFKKKRFLYNYMDRRIKAYQKTARLNETGINIPKAFRDNKFNPDEKQPWEGVPVKGDEQAAVTDTTQPVINPDADAYLKSLGF